MKKLILVISMLFSLPALAGEKNITLVVPYPPGGMSDIVARKTAVILENYLRTPVIVKNIAGGNNIIAINHVLGEKDADSIFILGNDDLITGPLSQRKDLYKEFVVTNIIGQSPYMLSTSGRKSSADVQATLKKGSLMFGSAGVGSGPAVWLTSLRGPITEYINIPYKGAANLIPDVIGGNLDYLILSSFNMYEYVQSGTFKPVMISSRTRLSKFPEVPTFQELGFRGNEDGIYFAIYARKTASTKVLQTINQAIKEAQQKGDFLDFENKSLVIHPWNLEQSNKFYQSMIKQKQQYRQFD